MPSMAGFQARIIAVLGKGGAGKTVFSALLARVILDAGLGPLLLVDADPTGGLAYAVGADMKKTMGEVRERVIRDAANQDIAGEAIAQSIDWLVLESLQEMGDYSLLAMGRTDSRGCFCPVNTLLRVAIEKLAVGFRFVILDAEAGIEQVNRQVVRKVDIPVVITDGSVRGLKAAGLVAQLLDKHELSGSGYLVLNRASKISGEMPENLELIGRIPEDQNVQEYDSDGISLLDLPEKSPALTAVEDMLIGKLRETSAR
ncbi:MAG: AAA family ATPase [Deltaproteobacteria bacterium]|nr:AAA family ATPase [Deltaproteobacteria bacterium]